MLSVHTAGCAGMERLGVPTRTSLTSPPDDRGQFSYRMRVEALQARELLAVRSETVIRSNNTSSSRNNNNITVSNTSSKTTSSNHHHHHHHQHQHQKQHSHQQHQLQQQQQKYFHRMQTNKQGSTLNAAAAVAAAAAGGTNCVANFSINTLMTETSQPNAEVHRITGSSSSSGTASSSCSNLSETTTTTTTGGGGGSGGGSSIGGCGSSSSSCDGHSIDSHSHDHHQHYQTQLQQQQTLRCPHHVPLPDSEWGGGGQGLSYLNRQGTVRVAYQQSEITRTCIKPPPNKTVKDVPDEASYNFYTHAAAATVPPPAALGLGVSVAAAGTLSSIYVPHHSNFYGSTDYAQPPQAQAKSKPNVITKLFSRKSSPKSPTSLSPSTSASIQPSGMSSASSSTSSSSPSPSSSSSLSSTMSLNQGISYDQRINCLLMHPSSMSCGSSLAVPSMAPPPEGTAAAPLPQPPPLSVTVPIVYHQQHNKQFYPQHQQLLDSIVQETATPTTSLQSLKSNSCPMTTTSSTAASDQLAASTLSPMSHKRHKSTVIPARRTSSPLSSTGTPALGPINMRRNTSDYSITDTDYSITSTAASAAPPPQASAPAATAPSSSSSASSSQS